MTNVLEKINQKRDHALKVLRKIEADKKFSEFAREKFNEAGININSSKAEDMLDELYDIAYGTEELIDKDGNIKKEKKAKSEDRIKAIKTFAEIVGGGLNEKQTNIQNNNYGNIFLDILSNSNDKK